MPSFKLNPDHIMEAVYSYPFPEVRKLLNSVVLPAEFMLNTLPVAQAAAHLEAYHFTPRLELPALPDGSLNLDELHVPIVERISKQLQPLLTGLNSFANAYPTPGSSQALFTLLAQWKAREEFTSLAVLEGEYEGYAAYATSLNIPITTYSSLESLTPKDGELWCISNPSAIDGNFISASIWKRFISAGHQIIYDAAYLGLTQKGSIDVSSPNIRAVLVSPSKVFGVFRYRLTGLCLTRQPVSSLYGTKWFKDIPALLDTLKLYETFAPHELPRTYKETQNSLCIQLSEKLGCTVTPSDTLLLASTKEIVAAEFQKYARIKGVYRFGLTKLFEDHERQMTEYVV